MAVKKRKQVKTKVKKKVWVKIIAPKIFFEKPLGESFVTMPEKVKGKYVSMNLMTLTGDFKKQNYIGTFKVEDVKGGVATTSITKLEMSSSGAKRLVRKNRNKIDDSFIAETAGNGKVRIKTITITARRISKPIQSTIRLKVRERLKNLIKKYSLFNDFVIDIMQNRIQRAIRDEVKKIYPVRNVEIRFIKLLSKEAEKQKEVKETKKEDTEENKNREELKNEKKEQTIVKEDESENEDSEDISNQTVEPVAENIEKAKTL